MSHVFPYGITLQEGGSIAVFPVAEVTFTTANQEPFSLFLIIDSGATISALPKSDAKIMGVQAEQGAPMAVSGIEGEPLNGWRHTIDVRIHNETISLPVLFLDEEQAPRILGRTGIFDHFTIVFEEGRRRSGLIDKDSSESKRITEILDTF